MPCLRFAVDSALLKGEFRIFLEKNFHSTRVGLRKIMFSVFPRVLITTLGMQFTPHSLYFSFIGVLKHQTEFVSRRLQCFKQQLLRDLDNLFLCFKIDLGETTTEHEALHDLTVRTYSCTHSISVSQHKLFFPSPSPSTKSSSFILNLTLFFSFERFHPKLLCCFQTFLFYSHTNRSGQ